MYGKIILPSGCTATCVFKGQRRSRGTFLSTHPSVLFSFQNNARKCGTILLLAVVACLFHWGHLWWHGGVESSAALDFKNDLIKSIFKSVTVYTCLLFTSQRYYWTIFYGVHLSHTEPLGAAYLWLLTATPCAKQVSKVLLCSSLLLANVCESTRKKMQLGKWHQ